ncbi:BatD family protein [Candidatus Foliamicus sp.]
MVKFCLRFGGATLALVLWLGAQAQTPAAEPPFVVRAELSERRPWERSQVIYTVRVYAPAGTRRINRIRSLDEPVLLGGEALVERLGNDREYSARPGDDENLMLVRRYAIFPQSAGELLLMPPSLKWIGGEFGFRVQTFVHDAEPERLEVRAVSSPPAGQWLTAEHVEIWDKFERSTDQLTAGEPLVRLLGVRVKGQPARQIPELSPGDGANFRHFMERAEFENQVTLEGLVGVRLQRAALLASRAGEVVLPALRFDWWNVSAERWETAELPERVLQARGVPAPAVSAPAALPAARGGVGEWLVGILALGWFLTGVAWWASNRIVAARRHRRELQTWISGQAEGAAPRRARALAKLVAACEQRDAQGAETALLEWSRTVWTAPAPRNLGELAACCGQPLSEYCRRLSAVLYSPRSEGWEPAELLAAARRAPRPAARSKAPRRALPPLWPKRAAPGSRQPAAPRGLSRSH